MFMVFLMFSSSIGFSMDFHFCGDELKSFSLLGEAEACEMMQDHKKTGHACCDTSKKEVKSCHRQEIGNGNCCHNESLVFANSGEFETSDFSFENSHQYFSPVVVITNDAELFTLPKKQVNFTHYHPPSITKDIPILLQVFLI
jgi:hypothetical protein